MPPALLEDGDGSDNHQLRRDVLSEICYSNIHEEFETHHGIGSKIRMLRRDEHPQNE